MNKWMIASGAAGLAMGAALWGSNAHAQYETAPPPTYTSPTYTTPSYAQTSYENYEAPTPHMVSAPSQAFELQLGTGYTQGFGRITGGTPIIRVAGAGIGFTGAVGYRINPGVSLEGEGQYQQFVAENSSSTNGLNVNLGVTVHGMPQARMDPFLRLGTGWRWIWQHGPNIGVGNNAATGGLNQFNGWQVATLRLGLDIRSSRGVAWAPVIGADLQSIQWQNNTSVGTWRWGTFVYAGLQGRFDLGGPGPVQVAKR